MVTMSAGRLAELVDGTVVAGDPDRLFTGVAIDSRDCVPGCAFFALPGERTDGHAWVQAAGGSGATVAIVSRWESADASALGQTSPDAIVRVPDVPSALEALATAHRASLRCPVVAITGSTGKTSTKDFVAAALATRGPIVATRGNRNNELGVPLTVLEADAGTGVLIVEMGMRAEGEIARSCAVVRPSVGLVTNIGQTHIEVLGTQEAIARAKGELVECVSADGQVFLNGDDPWSRGLAQRSAAAVTWYGLGASVDVRASDIEVDDAGCPTMVLSAGGAETRVTLRVPGRHNAYNAAAAASVALHLGVGFEDIREGLEHAVMTDMRMQVFSTASGVIVINDAYNASPTSMRAAIVTLAEMRAAGRRVAILGDMAELGSLSELAHFGLGEFIARAQVDVLVTIGTRAVRIADGALAEGMHPASVRPCESVEEASEVLDDLLEAGDVALVKASRCMGLEKIVEGMLSPHV